MSVNFPKDIPVPRFNPRAVLWALGAVLVIALLRTSVYTVEAESEGVVLRFGRYLTTMQPGLHFKLPFGIDDVAILPTQRQLKQEFGFVTAGTTKRSHLRTDPELEKPMVTGDLNAASVEWVIQYRITDPQQYLFKVRDPESTLRHASESVMREVVGDRTVDEVITIGRQEIESEALLKLQALIDKYEMGLSINQVQLKNVDPPEQVRASFSEVNQAQQEREQLINEANGEYNREVPKAEGEADQSISGAQGYATQRVNEAEGDAARFQAVLLEYIKAPEVTKRRMYLETLGEVIPKLGRKVVIDSEAKQILPLLQLSEKEIITK